MQRKWKPYEIGLALAAAVLLLAMVLLGGGLPCIVKSLVGLPCPSCGVSRALWSVFQGGFFEAFQWHPLWILVVLLPLLYFLQRGERFPRLMTLWRNKWFWAALLAALLLCYLLRMLLLYPHTPPMDPNPNAPVARLFRFFHR